ARARRAPLPAGRAADRVGERAVARRCRVLAAGYRAAAERRGTNAVGGARRTDRGRVVGPGIGVGTGGGRIGAVGEGFTVTGGLEIGRDTSELQSRENHV